ncbi:MAG: D-alanine--D-alanine ligase family protein [bacterium]
MKIVILHDYVAEDAPEDDRDIISQCEYISEALSDMGNEPIPVCFSLDFGKVAGELHRINPDLVFNLVESVNGQGNLIHEAAKLLDEIRMPYTGSKTESLISTSNKLIAKKRLEESSIFTPKWFSPEHDREDLLNGDGPYIIKSVWEHASKGLNQASIFHPKSRDELLNYIRLRSFQTGWDCFAEAYIDGREFNISLLDSGNGPEVLPPAEILFTDYPEERYKIVDYTAKWEKGSFEYQHTCRCFDFADMDGDLLRQLNIISVSCWNLFELRGYARVDFRIDMHGFPWVLEVNANPCLAPDSGFIAAAQRAGLSSGNILKRIINTAFI